MPTERDREIQDHRELVARREARQANRQAVMQCEMCPDLVVSRKKSHWGKPTYGYGDITSPVMFVGEAPGRDGCSYTGIPFTRDRSGQLYNWVLNYLGTNLESVYTTNIVKCWPADKRNNNRTPTDSEVRACLPHLLNEIRVVRPKKIVALGRVPERILRQTRANNPDMKILDVPIVYIAHPAFILRKGGNPGSDVAKRYANSFISHLGLDERSRGSATRLDAFMKKAEQ